MPPKEASALLCETQANKRDNEANLRNLIKIKREKKRGKSKSEEGNCMDF